MKTSNPSPRDELAEPLRSILEDMATEPVPEDLIQSARRFSVAVPQKTQPQQSALVIFVSIMALSLWIAALIVREEPPQPGPRLVKEETSIPTRPLEELPPPTFWAYRRAHSAEALDELLSQHATVLLPVISKDDLHPFSRKEEL
jgi:hypothetical protein